jgi:hypothetical protein
MPGLPHGDNRQDGIHGQDREISDTGRYTPDIEVLDTYVKASLSRSEEVHQHATTELQGWQTDATGQW